MEVEYVISNATARNWRKLQPNIRTKLTSRANKMLSCKMIVPVEYFLNKANIPFVQKLVLSIKNNRWEKGDILFSCAINLIKRAGLIDKKHVESIIIEYSKTFQLIDELLAVNLPNDEFDILGIIYQCLLFEGEKNIKGSYYTPKHIAKSMTRELNFSNGQTFLDPCCGSGAFLLSLDSAKPCQIFGIDNDPIAVMLAKFNLLLKFRNESFTPQIFCSDYISQLIVVMSLFGLQFGAIKSDIGFYPMMK